jgi:alpha-L-fucosidase
MSDCRSPFDRSLHPILCVAAIVATAFTAAVQAQSPPAAAESGHDEDAVARRMVAEARAPDGWWTRSMQSHDQRLAWWRAARFGCFMHWGVYSVLGGEYEGQPVRGYAEHIQRIRKIDQATYRRVAVEKFNPTEFDADQWAELLVRAGMKYLIITSKHHDGFAMFDSDVSSYNVVDATPFHRDPMRELRDACRRRGIRFGFYYSQAFDWGEAEGAGNDWEFDNPGGDKLLGGAEWWKSMPERLPRVREKYVDAKAIPQIKELIAKYDPDILWFDTSGKLPFSENLRILREIRQADPDVVVNGRLARGPGGNWGDYVNTGDRAEELQARGGDWEAIPTTNESYGWHQHDKSYKQPRHFIQLMAKAASRNGNMLLNVGPRGDGRIDDPDVKILEAIGAWMRAYGESIYGCGLTPLAIQPWGVSTHNASTGALYLHVFDWPADGKLVVGGLKSEPESIELLTPNGPQPVASSRLDERDLVLELPAAPPSADDSVVKLAFAGPIEADPVRLLAASAGAVNRLLAFDAEASRGLGYGDGKRDRYFVTGLNSPRRSLTWKVRLNEPTTYDVTIRYAGGDPQGTGSWLVGTGDRKLNAAAERPPRPEAVLERPLGKLTLPAGEHTIKLSSPDVERGEVGRPLEVRLTVVAGS